VNPAPVERLEMPLNGHCCEDRAPAGSGKKWVIRARQRHLSEKCAFQPGFGAAARFAASASSINLL
jgi:hypothetical protein